MNTDKIYAEQLTNEYAPKDTSKVIALRKLDAKAKLPAVVFAYTFGIIAAFAVKMDEAFLKLLETKDFTYITVKEICEAAGVNRSTFYLYYETINDLLSESVDHMTAQFRSYMQDDTNDFSSVCKIAPQTSSTL